MTNPPDKDGPADAVTPPGQTHLDDKGVEMGVATISPQTDIAGGYQYLVGAMSGVMTDDQIDMVLESCREHAHQADFIKHAARILERYQNTVCTKCRGSGRSYVPDPDGWSALERRDPEYKRCDGCRGSGRVSR